MSLSKNIEIKCPKCGENENIKVWQSINVTENKELKDFVFSQDIFKFKCSNCGTDIFIQYPFIYHDYDKKFFVYFDPSGEFKNIIETEGFVTKTASQYLEFLECIKILEDAIDIEILNNKKAELFDKFSGNEKLKNISKIYYSGKEKDKFIFFVPDINGRIVF